MCRAGYLLGLQYAIGTAENGVLGAPAGASSWAPGSALGPRQQPKTCFSARQALLAPLETAA